MFLFELIFRWLDSKRPVLALRRSLKEELLHHLLKPRHTNNARLSTLRTEWVSANSYQDRISNLRAGVGSPLTSLKATINVLNDANEIDSLTGGTGFDWYFRAVDDVITDLFAGAVVDVL